MPEPSSDQPAPAADLAAGRRHRGAADQVGSIIRAAETTAELMRADAEERVRARIAEGDRAAGYRIRAAEEEAEEIVSAARAEAERLAQEAREREEQSRTNATNEALAIIARAQESAAEAVSEAAQTVARTRQEAEAYSRELLGEAQSIAQEVRSEGMELVANLRQMGDSLRTNAERLLRDVQGVHSQMVKRIERVEARQRQLSGGRPAPVRDAHDDPSRRPRREAGPEPESFGAGGGEDFDVPEFMPRR